MKKNLRFWLVGSGGVSFIMTKVEMAKDIHLQM
jgi:hypothetical protein